MGLPVIHVALHGCIFLHFGKVKHKCLLFLLDSLRFFGVEILLLSVSGVYT